MRYFEFIDEKSSKFWKINNLINKKKLEVTFGKIGTEGRKIYHPYPVNVDGLIMMTELIDIKIKKGYIEKSTIKNTLKKFFMKTFKKDTSKTKECPPGKVRNPKTGRCINEKKPVKKKTLKKNHAIKKLSCKLPKSPIKITNNIIGTGIYCKSGNQGEKVYDIKEKGVMLAHVFRDSKNKIKPAPKGFPQAPNGWWVSEKYDGYRAIWDGKDFRSRNNNIFEVPIWFKDWLPASICLDGELFLGRENFEKCGLFRKKIPNDDEWIHAQVKYQIFDSPTYKGNFEKRQQFIEDLIKKKCICVKSKLPCPLVLTEQIKINNEDEVLKIYSDLIKKGAEGVMLRSPKSPYEPKRSSHLLKVKPKFDDECKIIGFKEGTGKYNGMLGSFNCELLKDKSIKFDISGMNDEIRKNYKKTHTLGSIVTFTHMGFMKSGVPRHPNYLRKRLSE